MCSSYHLNFRPLSTKKYVFCNIKILYFSFIWASLQQVIFICSFIAFLFLFVFTSASFGFDVCTRDYTTRIGFNAWKLKYWNAETLKYLNFSSKLVALRWLVRDLVEPFEKLNPVLLQVHHAQTHIYFCWEASNKKKGSPQHLKYKLPFAVHILVIYKCWGGILIEIEGAM